jgi:hypothetical protein
MADFVHDDSSTDCSDSSTDVSDDDIGIIVQNSQLERPVVITFI